MKDTWGRTINVQTNIYENSHCKRQSGHGNWCFHFGGYTYGEPLQMDFSFTGLYSEAKKAAVKQAAQNGRNLVVVCA